MAGFAVATVLLAAFWAAAMILLVRQDNQHESINLRADFEKFKKIRVRPRRLLRAISAYLRPDFHPLQMEEMDELAQQWLVQKGIA
jgi:predicted metal-dependent hydrolase